MTDAALRAMLLLGMELNTGITSTHTPTLSPATGRRYRGLKYVPCMQRGSVLGAVVSRKAATIYLWDLVVLLDLRSSSTNKGIMMFPLLSVGPIR